jgi:hypothetical protein
MNDATSPIHLSHQHRHTLERIFQHPLSHNLEWHDVLSLLESTLEVEQRREGHYSITSGSETHVFDTNPSKDLSASDVTEVRRLLRAGGLQPAG